MAGVGSNIDILSGDAWNIMWHLLKGLAALCCCIFDMLDGILNIATIFEARSFRQPLRSKCWKHVVEGNSFGIAIGDFKFATELREYK